MVTSKDNCKNENFVNFLGRVRERLINICHDENRENAAVAVRIIHEILQRNLADAIYMDLSVVPLICMMVFAEDKVLAKAVAETLFQSAVLQLDNDEEEEYMTKGQKHIKQKLNFYKNGWFEKLNIQ